MTSSKTGLFSAIVGAFIIEFYKKLSSDSGDQTVALLQQISHQLPISPNSTYSNTANQPSPPGTAMVWVIVIALWLISLVLSLTCALIATLLQQWARRYIETPKSTNMPRHRARVRSLLLVGTRRYNIPIIVEILPTLLHLSVYLFLGGLVITFNTVNKTVAIAVDVAVGVSGLAYIVLSVLPCLDVKCPYRTPISKILWYPCHALLSFAALCLHRCILGLHGLLNQPVLSRGQGVLLRWLKSRGFSVSNHWRFLTDGLEKSIVHRAVETLRDEDRERVTWLFNRLAIGDKRKFLKFAASIPKRKIPDFIPPIESVTFRESLYVLLRNCVTSRYTTWGDEDVQLSLSLCLQAISHIIKAKAPTIPDLNFIRAHFADTGLMRLLWGDMDDSIRISSRSICALVARQVVRKQRLKGAVLSWLQEVTGEPSHSILEAGVTVLDQMNFKSFVNGALPHRNFSDEDTTVFNETLAILLGIRTDGPDHFTTRDWQTQLSEEVGRIQRYDYHGGSEIFDRLRLVFPSLPHPVTTSAHPVVPILPPSPRVLALPLSTRPREAPPPHAPPSPHPGRPHAPPSPRPPPPRAPPSPRLVPHRAPPPPPAVYPPRASRPSHRAHRHHETT